MSERARVLILGGTGDAAELARLCATRCPDIDVINSLAGRTHAPLELPGETRRGGFGGACGLASYLLAQAVTVLVDATHPYAATMSRNARIAADELSIPRAQLVRPAWQAAQGDRWIDVHDMSAAAARIPDEGARVFLSTGRQDLGAFAHHANAWFLVRSIDVISESMPLQHAYAITGRGPFTLAQERDVLERYDINLLVSKNSGGEATYAKIVAARELGLPVLMVQRPATESGPIVTDASSALDWLRQQLATRR